MSERTNRRDEILEAATRLFFEQGYQATSVRQIADAVGCTEAALYYHFRDGKRSLLQAVVECNLPDMASVVRECEQVESLRELVACFGRRTFMQADRTLLERLRWLVNEFPTLSAEERGLLFEKHRAFIDALTRLAHRFIPDERKARYFAFLLMFVSFGYGQLMINLEFREKFDLDLDEFFDFAATVLSSIQTDSRSQSLSH